MSGSGPSWVGSHYVCFIHMIFFDLLIPWQPSTPVQLHIAKEPTLKWMGKIASDDTKLDIDADTGRTQIVVSSSCEWWRPH